MEQKFASTQVYIRCCFLKKWFKAIVVNAWFCLFRMKKGPDKLTIRELLSAAGVNNLNEVSDALNAKGKSFRRHGVVLHVTIKYTNTDATWFGTG